MKVKKRKYRSERENGMKESNRKMKVRGRLGMARQMETDSSKRQKKRER